MDEYLLWNVKLSLFSFNQIHKRIKCIKEFASGTTYVPYFQMDYKGIIIFCGHCLISLTDSLHVYFKLGWNLCAKMG